MNPFFLTLKIEVSNFKLELKSINISPTKVNSLKKIAHEILLTELLDFCLSELNDSKKKKEFLSLLIVKKEHKNALNFLINHIENFHIKLKKESLRIDLDLAQIVKNIKNNSN